MHNNDSGRCIGVGVGVDVGVGVQFLMPVYPEVIIVTE